MKRDNIALIDLDGTLADYDLAMRRELAKLQSPTKTLPEQLYTSDTPNHVRARMNLIKKQPGFWRTLPPIPVGMRVYDLMDEIGFRRMILTKGPKRTTTAWTEKVEWCREFVPDADITVTHDKGIVYGKMLFDDFPPYINAWLAHRPRGYVLMPDTVYNQDFKHAQVKRLPRDPSPEYWEEVKAWLQAAYDRVPQEG